MVSAFPSTELTHSLASFAEWLGMERERRAQQESAGTVCNYMNDDNSFYHHTKSQGTIPFQFCLLNPYGSV